jgi:hypothetical protein
LLTSASSFCSRLGNGCTKQAKTQGQKRGPFACTEEAEVADAHKAWRQDMQQEAPQELVHVQSHDALLIVVC